VSAISEVTRLSEIAEDLRLQLGRLVEAIDTCEGNRGRFSCCEAHDCRCGFVWFKGKRPGRCTCGADDLEREVSSSREMLAVRQ
jgi:hypothetical protein